MGWTRAARRAELTGYNLGIRGDTSAQIQVRWNAEVTRHLPAEFEGRVVSSFGANDCVQEVAPSDSLANAEEILSAAKVRWPIYMVGPAPLESAEVGERIARLDGEFARLCSSLAVPYLRVFDALMSKPTRLDEARMGDGAHPESGGYGHLAEIGLASTAWRCWLAP